MEFSSENLERAVWQFYQNDTSSKSQAHEWLKKAKNSPEAWSFVWDLLQPQKTSEVQFFAATTLHTKIKKTLNELTSENILMLRERLLAAIIAYSSGPKIVLNRLCISVSYELKIKRTIINVLEFDNKSDFEDKCIESDIAQSQLSAYLLQVWPETWPDALPSLLLTFTPENLPQVAAERALWVLLEILIVLPEELSSMDLHNHQKSLVRHHLNENTPAVMNVLEKIITSNTDQEVIIQAVKCASSWITIGAPFTQYQNLSNLLVNLVFTTHKHHPSICEKVLECLKVIVDQPENYKYPTYLLEFLAKILPLREIIERELTEELVDQELISNIYNLFLSFGGVHPKLCLNWIKQGGDAREQVMSLITSILECSGARGYYPVDETYSRLTFGFWYILQDEIVGSPPEEQELFMKYLGPVYEKLVSVLIIKAQLPDVEQNFTEEDLESFRCYRQDISDTLMYCNSILHETTIQLIQSKLEKINVNETKWQELEACLFSLSSISENVELDENSFLPSLFKYIKDLPFQRLNPKVFSTALDTIGAYADWISGHSSTLAHVLPLIILGLNVPETTSSATMALKDLARNCQYDIKPYTSSILDASQKALHGGRLKLNDSQRLMCTVGILLSVLPLEMIMHYLNLILTPYMDQLNSLSLQQASPQVKSNILLCLKMIGVLSASLNTKPEINSDNGPNNSQISDNEPQPVLIILHKILPTLKLIANSWSADEQMMQSLFQVLKHSVMTLSEDAESAVTDILEIIVSTFRVHPHPAAFDLSKTLCSLFGKNHEAIMQSLTNELCSVTMTNLSSVPHLSHHTDLLEAFFVFLAQILKKVPKMILCTDTVSLFQCATITLAIPELPTVKAAACFLVNFIDHSGDTGNSKNVVNAYGQQLVLQIVSCIAGEASRSNIDPLAQILLALNRKYCESHPRWLRQAVTEAVCPRTTPQQRESFITAVIVQKNKGNLQEAVKKFSLICRGILGTEYAQSANPCI